MKYLFRESIEGGGLPQEVKSHVKNAVAGSMTSAENDVLFRQYHVVITS